MSQFSTRVLGAGKMAGRGGGRLASVVGSAAASAAVTAAVWATPSAVDYDSYLAMYLPILPVAPVRRYVRGFICSSRTGLSTKTAAFGYTTWICR